MLALTLLFFVVAIIYSMVGFGGGSSYIALLALFAIPHTVAPSIALICNLIVVTGSTVHFYRKKLLNTKLLLSFALTSIPSAYIGGLIPMREQTYHLLLATALILAALNMLFYKKREGYLVSPPKFLISSLTGSFLGLISGMVGIGGGIFLAPIMYTFKWGSPREISAISASFILVNSLAGLFGQIQKGASLHLNEFIPLFLAVLVGGQLGSLIGILKMKQRKIEVFTAFVIIYAAGRLLLIA